MKAKKEAAFHIANLILLACAMTCLVLYDIHGGRWLKGVTSSWFVLIGLVNLVCSRIYRTAFAVPRLILSGLFLGMCADILLGIHFMSGILAFALGHVLYLAAFCFVKRPCRADLLFILPAAAISLLIVTCTPWIRITDPMIRNMLIGYALIIGCMLGKACGNYLSGKTPFALLILTGSALFWFSDVMLAINMFGNGGRLAGQLCCYTYWPAQNILAYSLFHWARGYARTSA